MSLETDDILGFAYLSAADFKARKVVFGVRAALPASDDEITALLATASRLIDVHCGRAFTPDVITETHRFDLQSRRISVNQPPVAAITSFKLITGPGMSSTIDLSAIFSSVQENYIELVAFAQAVVFIPELLTLGLVEPQVEVQYQTYQAVPQAVAAACGFTAAALANRGYVNANIPEGLARIKLGNTFEAQRDVAPVELPAIARQMLAPFRRIAVG